MFYTYLWLREDGTPYYVGKGKGNRGFESRHHRHRCPPRDRIIIQEWPSEEEAFSAEIFLILYYGREDLGTGCLRNLTNGGDSPPKRFGTMPLSTKEAIRKSLTGRHLTSSHKENLRRANAGKTLSGECRRKMGEAHKGHVVTAATRKKIGDAHIGRAVNEETRSKMSNTRKGRPAWNKGKKQPRKLKENQNAITN